MMRRVVSESSTTIILRSMAVPQNIFIAENARRGNTRIRVKPGLSAVRQASGASLGIGLATQTVSNQALAPYTDASPRVCDSVRFAAYTLFTVDGA